MDFAVGPNADLQERFRDIALDGIPLPLVDAVRTAVPVWIASGAELAARYPELDAIAGGVHRFGAVIAALPLVVEGRAMGGLSLTWDETRELSEEERLHALLVAQHCGQALARAHLYEAERRARAEAEQLRERAAFLASASALLASSVEYAPTLESLAFLAVPRFADWCAVELAPEVAHVEPVIAHADPAKVEQARELSQRYPRREEDPGGVSEVLRTGRSQLYPEIGDEMLVASARDAEHLRILREMGIRSAMVVALQ